MNFKKIRFAGFLIIIVSLLLMSGQNLMAAEKSNKEELLENMLDIPIKDFQVAKSSGEKVKLSDFKGKIVFLSFWATWCPPCREEMPKFQKIYDEYKDEDVVIVAVNSTTVELRGGNDSARAEKQVKEFMEKNEYTFPIYFDKDNSAWDVYQQRGIPTNYIIDKNGVIRYGFAGAYISVKQMKKFIDNIHAIEE